MIVLIKARDFALVTTHVSGALVKICFVLPLFFSGLFSLFL